MNKEKIQALIFSDIDEQKLVKKLMKWFTKKPELINERYVFDRTVFHLLVIKNKAKALELLLENATWIPIPDKTWQAVAALPDRSGNTLLHCTVRADEKFQAPLKSLLKLFPDQIKSENKDQNTPLHEAVLSEKVWSVKLLIADKNCNRSTKNGANQTPLDLAKINSEIRNALFSIDLSMSTNNSLEARHRQGTSIDNLRDLFPSITSAHSSSSISSSNSSKESSPHQDVNIKKSHSELSVKDDEVLKVYPFISMEEVLKLLKQITTTYRDQKRSPAFLNLQNEFHTLCLNSLLPDEFNLSNDPFFRPSECKGVLSNALGALAIDAEQHYARLEDTKSKLLKSFVLTIIPHMSNTDSEPRPVLNEQQDPTFNSLWLLASCQESIVSKRVFNFDAITHRALGIMNSIPLLEILVYFRRMYPYFDTDQKLVTNFIIMQLLYYSVINDLKQTINTDLQLKLLCKLNSEEKGLGKLGEVINHHLNKINQLNAEYFKHPLLRNYIILNQQLSHPLMSQSLQSFDGLINQALAKTRHSRKDEVQKVVHELRMLSFRFYQRVSMTEFYDNSWAKQDKCPDSGDKDHECDSHCKAVGKSTLAPNIVESTADFNKLNNYFVAKLLSQPSENITNALKFIIEIGLELCPLVEGQYHDLNHLMVISSVLNCSDLTRAINFSDTLSSKDLSRIEDINQIVDKAKNSKYMRDLYKAFKKTLPFVGELLTDVTFANDANPVFIAELNGLIFKKLMEVKVVVNFERRVHHTNLPLFIAKYAPLNDELIYNASLRQHPRKSDTLLVENTSEALTSILDALSKEFLPQGLIPSLVVNKKEHQPSQIPALFIELFTSKLKAFKKEQDKIQKNDFITQESKSLVAAFNKLQRIIPDLVNVLNTYYVPLKLSDFKKIELFKSQLDELHKLLLSMKLVPNEPGSNPPNKPTSTMSAYPSEKHGFFKLGNDSANSSVDKDPDLSSVHFDG